MTFEVFTAVKIHLNIFWFVTPITVALRYQRFTGPSCLYLQGENGGSHDDGGSMDQ
jgi:hypothetical protein